MKLAIASLNAVKTFDVEVCFVVFSLITLLYDVARYDRSLLSVNDECVFSGSRAENAGQNIFPPPCYS